MTRKYYIVWNADRTEGFVTADKRDATSAQTGRAHFDAELGLMVQSPLGEEFHTIYDDENCTIQEVEI